MSAPIIPSPSGTPPIDIPDEHGQTALVRAVKCHNLSNVLVLLAQGANVTIADDDGWQPLHYALINDYGNPSACLDDEEEEEDPWDASEDPCIADARRRIVHALVNAPGVQLEARTWYEETPLLVAAKNVRSVGDMAFLIVHGANVNAIDDDDNGIEFHPFGRDVAILRRLASLVRSHHGRVPLISHDRVVQIDRRYERMPREDFVQYVKVLVASFGDRRV